MTEIGENQPEYDPYRLEKRFRLRKVEKNGEEVPKFFTLISGMSYVFLLFYFTKNVLDFMGGRE